MRVVVVSVEPVNHIAPRQFVLHRQCVVANAGGVKLSACVQGEQVVFQIGRQIRG